MEDELDKVLKRLVERLDVKGTLVFDIKRSLTALRQCYELPHANSNDPQFHYSKT